MDLSDVACMDMHALWGELRSGPDGLSEVEAGARLAACGANAIVTPRGMPLAARFLSNFTHLMAVLLWAGGLVGMLANMPELGVAIWLVNIINGTFSFWQEYRAEKATEALRRLLPETVDVVRAGLARRVRAETLVPGDVIRLAEGDRIPADARLVSACGLVVDQSTLSGESAPVAKDAAPPQSWCARPEDLPDIVFAGTTVLRGDAVALVVATGMKTEFGKIARLTHEIGLRESPLEIELKRVSKTVAILAGGIGCLFFFLAVTVTHVSVAEGFIFAMGMIVAFVPEGMLPTVTLSLALAVERMARRNALVKRLSAVETLGCATVICTDKTGTLTKNEMTVKGIYTQSRFFQVSGDGYNPAGTILPASLAPAPAADGLTALLSAGVLCNNASLAAPPSAGGAWTVSGDPTEAALIVAAIKGGIDVASLSARFRRVGEFPFDSARKRMSVVHDAGGQFLVSVKGAPGEMLSISSRIMAADGCRPLTDSDRSDCELAIDGYAQAGLRVLAVAEKTLTAPVQTIEEAEGDLTLIGLVAMWDPPHDEVPAAIASCRQAGIKVVMVTGDHGLTAVAIAEKIGLAGSRAYTAGPEIDRMGEAELTEAIVDGAIFARCTPQHKLRVVSALKAQGHVVAVTGDGVNDAPCLRRADIGVAMGRAGTDVARGAADIILLDDNFASIVSAVEEGRAVYANIRRFAVYVFNSNMAEAVPFVTMLFSGGAVPLPLTVMQVLSIDLGTDMIPAIGLGADPPAKDVMRRPPRSLAEPLLGRTLLLKALLWYGLIEAGAGMSCYLFFNWRHGLSQGSFAQPGTPAYAMATTMTLAGIVMSQVGAVFCCRTDRQSIFAGNIFANRLILAGVATELALLAALLFVPGLNRLFGTSYPGAVEMLFACAWCPVIIFLDEGRKLVMRLATRAGGRRIER